MAANTPADADPAIVDSAILQRLGEDGEWRTVPQIVELTGYDLPTVMDAVLRLEQQGQLAKDVEGHESLYRAPVRDEGLRTED